MAKKKLSEYTKIEEPATVEEVGAIPETKTEDEPTPFLPTLFDQLETDTIDTRPTLKESPENQVTLDAEDIEIIIELPFDAAAQITKWPGWTLSDKERKALSRLWITPFREWLKNVDNLPIYLASIATVTVLGEKYLGYKIEQQERAKSSLSNNSAGNEGIRKN